MLARPIGLAIRLASGLALALILLFTTAAAAGPQGPGTRAVRKANETIAGLLRQKAPPGSPAEKQLATRVTRSVRDFLDIEELGRRALADHWAKLSPTQQKEYMELLRSLIEASYVRGLRANLDYQVAYIGETEKGSQRIVSTEIRTKRHGRPHVIEIDYVLTGSAGALRAFDVVTDGVGLVENYRAQFNKIISREGFDGLLERMKKKSQAQAS